ncbi:MAG: glutamate racemase [Deltaproteobacteria bacterium]|nr:glutamate racemase [Deltaproteobacteria bacterium]
MNPLQGAADRSSAIGVFDSGVGGLTVVRAVMERLPSESILYFGDTARVPYGVKSVETIVHFAGQITEFLLRKRVKLLIVACNTMSAVALEVIRSMSPVPVLDVIHAGAKSAAEATRSGYVAVIGTPATIESNAYVKAIHRLDPAIRVVSQACALFVPLVEEGWLDHPITKLTAKEYLRSILQHPVDSLVLGCTHYPLIKPVIREVVGNRVQLVDSAEAMAQEAERVLQERGLSRPSSALPEYRFCVTDIPLRFRTIGERFLGRSLSSVEVVQL